MFEKNAEQNEIFKMFRNDSEYVKEPPECLKNMKIDGKIPKRKNPNKC